MPYLFVYGNMKQHFPKNYLVSKQKYIKDVETQPIYLLYDSGPFPCMTRNKEGKGLSIKGELWEVNNKTMGKLGKIHKIPYIFKKEQIYLLDFKELCIGFVFYGSTTGMEECGNSWIKLKLDL